MPNAAKRAEIKTRSATKKTAAPAEPTKTTAEVTAELTSKTKVRGGPSIRGLITGMIKEGKSTQEITDAVKEQFPDSAAAAKPSKHIAFYKSRLKKDAAKGQAKAEVQGEAAKAVSAKKGAAKKG